MCELTHSLMKSKAYLKYLKQSRYYGYFDAFKSHFSVQFTFICVVLFTMHVAQRQNECFYITVNSPTQ